MTEVKKLDLQNTKEVLTLGFRLGKALKMSKENDGSITAADIGNLLIVFPSIGPAFDNISMVPAELKNMDTNEAKDLMLFASTELGGVFSDAEIVDKIEAALELAVAAIKLASKF